jgi:hypothetical protein
MALTDLAQAMKEDGIDVRFPSIDSTALCKAPQGRRRRRRRCPGSHAAIPP